MHAHFTNSTTCEGLKCDWSDPLLQTPRDCISSGRNSLCRNTREQSADDEKSSRTLVMCKTHFKVNIEADFKEQEEQNEAKLGKRSQADREGVGGAN